MSHIKGHNFIDGSAVEKVLSRAVDMLRKAFALTLWHADVIGCRVKSRVVVVCMHVRLM